MLRLLERLKSWDYLRKWLVLGMLIGTVAGLASIAFIVGLEHTSKLLLETIGGYAPPLPAGEGHRLTVGSFERPWAIPLVVGFGGLVSGILVSRFAPEAAGHGTDAAIGAIHHNPRGLRWQATLVKLVSSIAMIGSGGSGGREGPTAQISAGFGSLLARRLSLSPRDARIAVAVGVGSGIGAIFRAPLGGAVLATEILYRDDFEPEALFPSLVASIVGFSIFGAAEGFKPIFGTLHTHGFSHPAELFYFALLGIAAGLVARVYARSFYGMDKRARALNIPPMLKPAAAGLLVGLLGLAFPEALGTGYGWVQRGMRGGLPDVALWVVLAVPFVKILATSLSVGSGGSGGIFGPGMVIGGFVGLGIWRMLHGMAPGMPDVPTPFIVVGMIACFGSVAHAPLSVMLMVGEMTGSLALLPPAMVAIGLATLMVGSDTIYESQLRSRADSPAHRAAFGMPMLGAVHVADVMARPRLVLPADIPATEAYERLEAADLPGAPVVKADGRFSGVLQHDAAEPPGPGVKAIAAVDAFHPTLPADSDLGSALDALASADVSWVPVLDGEKVVGIIAMKEVIRGYQDALRRTLRLLTGTHGSTALVEARIEEGSPIVGSTVGEVEWPAGSVVLSIERRNHLIAPRADTPLQVGDVGVVIAPVGREDELRSMFGAAGE